MNDVCKMFSKYENEIRKYCSDNNLDFEKVKKMSQSWSKNDIWLQYFDASKGEKGLLDETPAPIVLKIFIKNDVLTFEQTEFTKKYLQ